MKASAKAGKKKKTAQRTLLAVVDSVPDIQMLK